MNTAPATPANWTREQPAEGLVVYQPRHGFRYALEPFLLAGWALEGGQPDRVLDVGTGSGIIGLLLARQGCSVDGIDVRAEWGPLAQASASESGLDFRFTQADVRSYQGGPYDLAMLNPPYFAAHTGKISPDPWKAAARTELNGDLGSLLRSTASRSDRACVVLDQRRAEEAASVLAQAGKSVRRRLDLDDALSLLEATSTRNDRVQYERASVRDGGVGWSQRVHALYRRIDASLHPIAPPRH